MGDRETALVRALGFQIVAAVGLGLVGPAVTIAAPVTVTPYFVDSAGRGWAALWQTWSVLPEKFLAVCDATTGACNGVLSDESVWGDRQVDLTGWVWATREESLNLISEYTSVSVNDLIGDPEGYWVLECGDGDSNDDCPVEFFAWADLVIENATRHGHSSLSFIGVSRDDILYSDDGGTYWTGWYAYWLGEGTAYFTSSSGDVYGVRTRCIHDESGLPSDEECWEAWGHFLYLPAAVPEPRALSLLAFGLLATGWMRRAGRLAKRA